MADPDSDIDPQDAAEAFDEDNLDDTETYTFKTFEENPDLLDLTRAEGDGDEEDEDEEFLALEDEDLEDEEDERVRTDGYDESDLDDVTDRDARDGVDDEEAEDSPLVFVGDVDNLRGAQGSAAHFEPRAPLSDDDVEALGYADEEG